MNKLQSINHIADAAGSLPAKNNNGGRIDVEDGENLYDQVVKFNLAVMASAQNMVSTIFSDAMNPTTSQKSGTKRKKMNEKKISTLRFQPPGGFPCILDVPFPEKNLPVCEGCKKNFRSRTICRSREGHQSLPWATTFMCITLDKTCTEDVANNDGNRVEQYTEGPFKAELLEGVHQYVAPINICQNAGNDKVKGTEKGCKKGKQNCKSKSPSRSIIQEPICIKCKNKNYTRAYCRDKLKHRGLPWRTTYIKLSKVSEKADEKNYSSSEPRPSSVPCPSSEPRPSKRMKSQKTTPKSLSKKLRRSTRIAAVVTPDYNEQDNIGDKNKDEDLSDKKVVGVIVDNKDKTASDEEADGVGVKNKINVASTLEVVSAKPLSLVSDVKQRMSIPGAEGEPNDDLTKIAPSRTFVVAISSRGCVVRWVDQPPSDDEVYKKSDVTSLALLRERKIVNSCTPNEAGIIFQSPEGDKITPSPAVPTSSTVNSQQKPIYLKEAKFELDPNQQKAIPATHHQQDKHTMSNIKGRKFHVAADGMSNAGSDVGGDESVAPSSTSNVGGGGAKRECMENEGRAGANEQNNSNKIDKTSCSALPDPKNLDGVGYMNSSIKQHELISPCTFKYTVVLDRSSTPGVGFGLTMADSACGKKCLVRGLNPHAALSQSSCENLNKIRVGDEVVGVNGLNVTHLNFEQIALAIGGIQDDCPLILQLVRAESKTFSSKQHHVSSLLPSKKPVTVGTAYYASSVHKDKAVAELANRDALTSSATQWQCTSVATKTDDVSEFFVAEKVIKKTIEQSSFSTTIEGAKSEHTVTSNGALEPSVHKIPHDEWELLETKTFDAWPNESEGPDMEEFYQFHQPECGGADGYMLTAQAAADRFSALEEVVAMHGTANFNWEGATASTASMEVGLKDSHDYSAKDAQRLLKVLAV